MSTLKVNSISDAAGANGNAITLATDGTCTAKVTNNLSNRNLIINGAMQVAQRGTSYTSDQQSYQTVDRFQVTWGGADSVIEQHQGTLTSSDTGPWEEGFRHSYHIQNGNQTGGGDAGDFCYIRQKIENQNIFFNASEENKQSIIDTFTDENSDINPYYPRFKSHQLDITEFENVFKVNFFVCIFSQGK